jgi:hypothetical protein
VPNTFGYTCRASYVGIASLPHGNPLEIADALQALRYRVNLLPYLGFPCSPLVLSVVMLSYNGDVSRL